MANLEELHKMIRLLRCINMPVSSIHSGLYSKLLWECETVTQESTHVRPVLQAQLDVKLNIQRIIEAVKQGLFTQSDIDMMTAVDVYGMSNNCVTSLEAAKLFLKNDAHDYIHALNEHNPTEVYFELFHQFDRIGRDDTGKIVSIATSENLYRL